MAKKKKKNLKHLKTLSITVFELFYIGIPASPLDATDTVNEPSRNGEMSLY